ncbi:MAG TPA: malonyl-CoA synthase [Hyphomicrobium sp.]|nr:malonyl-CoA synthase [Hyphomicrobium sp.]
MANPLYDALLAPHAGKRNAFLIAPDGSQTSYAEFLHDVSRMAHALIACGVKPGARVAVQVEKSQAALALYGACILAGAVFLPLNTAYTSAEVAYFVADAQPTLIVCDPAASETLASCATEHHARLETLDRDAKGSLASLAARMPDTFAAVARASDDMAAILYTSGTTGRSKGAVLSHGNLLSNALALRDIWRFTPADRLLHALPIFHVHGLFVATNVMLAAGGSMIFLPRFDAEQVISLLASATAMMGVPTFYTRLLASPAFMRERASRIRLFVSGSAPLLPATFADFEARTGKRILERYGMTETGMITSNPYEGERRAGAVGLPLPGVSVRVADPETGAVLPAGQTGVIEVCGPNVFSGYWRRPDLRDSEFRTDGYFITGDLGLIDEGGYVFIVGRAKDLVISGGLNVYPKEVETLIDGLEGVVESAVFGVPHPDLGEAVTAAVVAAPDSKLDAQAIKAALAGQLAGFKQPKAVFLVADLPRNTMGKVQKNILRQTYRDVFQGAEAK